MNLLNELGGKQTFCVFTVMINLILLPRLSVCDGAAPTPTISTKNGQLRGFYREVTDRKLQVATYLGIPYATPPIGANRFSPTRALSQWVGVHEAIHFGPSCPQRFPDLSNETEALTRMSKDRYDRLLRYEPALKRQSEDCLYLNIYVPPKDPSTIAYPVVIFIHGESFEWGSSSLYDGSILAALGKIIVITINYRLGILGFYNAISDPVGRAKVANYGLMDQLAALHWVQENIVRFGGDPGQVTVMGHGTGAACLNFLVISPTSTGAGLFKRAILMSGSALSPWAFVQDPARHAIDVATQLNCSVPKDLVRQYESLLKCLREKTVEQILQVQLDTSKFQVAVGPSVDGVTIKPDWKDHQSKMGKEGRTPVDLLLGMTASNILDILSDREIKEGFDADHQEQIFRSFVVNNYRYHLQEIMLAITAEYTDWSISIPQPISVRDSTGQALHDANVISPMMNLAKQLHTTSRTSFLYVIENRATDDLAMEENETTPMSELPYIFGGPLGALGPLASSYNFTKTDITLSQSFITMWSNFIKFGHPNDPAYINRLSVDGMSSISGELMWPKYDPVHQRYLDIGTQSHVLDHYRAEKVAMWSWLLPGLEKVGTRYGTDPTFHRLPSFLHPELFPGADGQYNVTGNLSSSPDSPTATPSYSPANLTIVAKANTNQVTEPEDFGLFSQMGRDFPYTTALSVTVAIACSLLILNILVLTTVYYRHKANRRNLAKNSQDANSESGNDVQLHTAGDTCKTIFAPGHYGTLRPSITMRSNLATAFEEESPPDWPPDYVSSIQTVDDISGVTSNKKSPEVNPGLVTPVTKTQTIHEPVENILSVAALKQPVASYTSPNDGQFVQNYSPSDTQVICSYSPSDAQLIPSYSQSIPTEIQ